MRIVDGLQTNIAKRLKIYWFGGIPPITRDVGSELFQLRQELPQGRADVVGLDQEMSPSDADQHDLTAPGMGSMVDMRRARLRFGGDGGFRDQGGKLRLGDFIDSHAAPKEGPARAMAGRHGLAAGPWSESRACPILMESV